MRGKHLEHFSLSAEFGEANVQETSDGNVVLKFEQRLGSLHGLRPGPVGRQDGKQHQDPGAHKTSRQRRRDKRAASAEKVNESKQISKTSPTSLNLNLLTNSWSTKLKKPQSNKHVKNVK